MVAVILFQKEIAPLKILKTTKVLDVGTGTGSNLRMLKAAGFSNVFGLDFNREAVNFCKMKGYEFVRQGDICSMPYRDKTFGFVFATDIIEHIEDHQAALKEITRVLKPGGHAIITVPAFKSLWGWQDEVSHHQRRYKRSEVSIALNLCGLTIVKIYYFNFILFLPIFFMRKLMLLSGLKPRSENSFNSRGLNFILKLIFKLDCLLAANINIPFGVSIFALVKKHEKQNA